MSKKNKIIISNLLILILSLVLLGQVSFLLLTSVFRRDDNTSISVEAANDINVIKKTGLLDLVGEGSKFNLDDQVLIKDKQQFVLAFNGYFEKLKESGGYSLVSDGIISANAASITAYQAIHSVYEVDADGNIFIESITAEVPSSSGSTTGYGDFVGRRLWVFEENEQYLETHDVSYTKDGSKYILNASYSGDSVTREKDREQTLLPFIVNENTISSFNIIENAMSYDIKIILNADGYAQIAKDTKDQGNAVRMPQYHNFGIDITMDKLGKVISISVSQNYVLTVKRIGLNFDADTKLNQNYLIKKKELV